MEAGPKDTMDERQTRFNGLFVQHYEEIYRYLSGMYPEQVEDLVQETFMTLLDRLEEVEESTVRAWLYRVAMNKGIDAVRSNKRRSLRHEHAHTLEATHTEGAEVQVLVRLALEKLEERQVQLLHLYSCGLSYEELACVLGVQKSSISQLLSRAKKAFEESYQRFSMSA